MDNFINMAEVKPMDETLEQVASTILTSRIDISKPNKYVALLAEYRNELQDSQFNFMELNSSKKIDYLNFAEF